LKSDLFSIRSWGTAISPHPSQKSFEQTTGMAFGRRLANLTSPAVRYLCCPLPQNLIKEAPSRNHGKTQLVSFLYR